ncbi:hypothetical protein KJ830_01005 [bacterium]|nr:hypothetical protein [bacterium]
MKITWKDTGDAEWEGKEREDFIQKFENKIWPSYYNLLQNQPISSMGVNIFDNLNKEFNLRIDFEVSEDRSLISIYIFPWICVHRPTSISDAWKNGKLWCIGRVEM